MKSLRTEIAWPFPVPVSVLLWAKDHDPSVVRSIWNVRVAAIKALFDGGTDEAAEDQARALILAADSYAELAYILNALGWDALDDDLDEQDLTDIAARVTVLRDRVEHQVDRVLLGLSLDPEAFADMPSASVAAAIHDRVESLGAHGAQRLAADLVAGRTPLLDAIALFALRGLPTRFSALRLLLGELAARVPSLAPKLGALDWEAFYDDRVCAQLELGRYRLLITSLPDLVDATLPDARRVAFFDTLGRRDDELRAMQTFIGVMGTTQQRTDVERFMDARRLFMDHFTPSPPPASVIEEIAAFFGSLASEVVVLRADVVNATQGMIDALTFGHLLQTESDDQAREVVGALGARRAVFPERWKAMLIRLMEEGNCDDDDEQAILQLLAATKGRSIAEFAQLVAAQGWESLSFSFDGQEYDDLEGMLSSW